MLWRGQRQSENVEDRRGMSGGRLAIGGGLGGIVLLVIALLLGAVRASFYNSLPVKRLHRVRKILARSIHRKRNSNNSRPPYWPVRKIFGATFLANRESGTANRRWFCLPISKAEKLCLKCHGPRWVRLCRLMCGGGCAPPIAARLFGGYAPSPGLALQIYRGQKATPRP